MSATLPARLGEPSRALIVARRLGRARERLPVVLGTLVSQTLLNVLALVILGAVMFTTIGLFAGRQQALLWYALAPFAVLVRRARGAGAAPLRPAVALRAGRRAGSRRRARRCARALGPGRLPRARGSGAVATVDAARRLGAAVGRLLRAARRAGPRRHGADLGAAAAVLFAVNVTAVLPRHPVEPRRLPGRLHGGARRRLRHPRRRRRSATGSSCRRSRSPPRSFMGAPALVKEGLSWREVRLRALHTAPVVLLPGAAAPRPSSPQSPRRACSMSAVGARRSAARRRPRGGARLASLASSSASEASRSAAWKRW